MVLKQFYEKLYNKIFSVPFFKKLLKIPGVEKLLQYEIISYLVFGVLTTAVNMASYWLVNKFAGEGYETKVLFSVNGFDFRWIYLSNAAAWIISVLFAFITNKLFVFESRSFASKTVIKELSSFVGARIISFLVFEELVFGLLAGFMNSYLAKIIVAVFVVIFNYIASKLVIFKRISREEKKQ